MRKLRTFELDRITVEEYAMVDKHSLVVILDNVRSLNNIGSIFRTADAFLIESIYLCGISATPPHNDIHKTALGAEDSVTWHYCENTLDALSQLRAKGYIIFAVEQATQATLLQNWTIEAGGRYAVIFGNEVKGVDQKVVDACDGCLEIPQFGTKHSLNVSITAGIVIWDYIQKLKYNKQQS